MTKALSAAIFLVLTIINIVMSQSNPVNVEVYFESYCPDSIRFINNQLYPAWKKFKGLDVIDLKLFPYGKAERDFTDGQYEFSCQHGSKECQVNIIENCVIDVSENNTSTYLPIIDCLMRNRREKEPNEDIENCVEQGDMDYNKVQACMESDHGNELLFKAGAATDNLNPRLTYVPWVMINGMRNNTAELEFFKIVQQAYMQENGQIAPTNPPGGSAYRNFSNVIILISTLLSAILI